MVTGPSGSGKSSLAFHTLYAEGQRRYVETFSPYVRQFFARLDKPAVDSIDGIPPAIAIEQKNHVRSTRSTVGTLTEINDYLKVLFARLATGHDPGTGDAIQPDSPESAARWAMETLAGQTVWVTFPVPVPAGTQSQDFFAFLHAQGYLRVLYQKEIIRTDEPAPASLASLPSSLDVLQDRITLTIHESGRLLEALEAAFLIGKGRATVVAAVSPGLMDGRGQSPGRDFSSNWVNPATGFTLRAPTPALFSFNNPLGACPTCRGFGRIIGLDLSKTVPDPSLSIARGAIKPFQGERGEECQRDLIRCCKKRHINPRTPWADLTEKEKEWIYYGDRNTEEITPEALEELFSKYYSKVRAHYASDTTLGTGCAHCPH